MSVTVFGFTTGCKYCTVACNTLSDKGVDYKFVDVREDPNMLSIFKQVHNTVPQIYKDGKHLGGSESANLIDADDFGDLSL